jgi:hypothetical protein
VRSEKASRSQSRAFSSGTFPTQLALRGRSKPTVKESWRSSMQLRLRSLCRSPNDLAFAWGKSNISTGERLHRAENRRMLETFGDRVTWPSAHCPFVQYRNQLTLGYHAIVAESSVHGIHLFLPAIRARNCRLITVCGVKSCLIELCLPCSQPRL